MADKVSLATLALAKAYTDESIEGAGAIKGKNCEIQSIEPITGGNRVTFAWYDGSDIIKSGTMDVMDGEVGAKGDTGDTGATGATGNGIASIEKTSTVGNVDTYTITMTDGTTATFTVTNGGVNVVANPEGTASDSLTKIQIGNIVYGVEGGGDASLESDVTANTTVGAIGSGTTIDEGTTFTEFVQKLLISEIAPTTSFSASGSGTKETGTSVTSTLTLNITSKGTGTPIAIKFYSGSTLLDTQAYVDGTNTYTYTMETAISTTTTVKGVLEYTKSDGTTATVEKTATYTFVMASYYGAVATAPTDKAGIIALTKVVKTTKGQTATFNLSNQRSCYCYPASMGNLTSIKDSNGFEYISGYTKTNVSVDGESYNVYTQTDPVTASNFKQIYS